MRGYSPILALALLIQPACSYSGSGSPDGSVPDAVDGTDGGDVTGITRPYLGILQFHILHNLFDDSCVQRDDCSLSIENEDDTANWLSSFRGVSNLAVLHWDRTIPWLAFDEDPPQGTDRIAFYDGRIDAKLLAWIEAFADHFDRMPYGYLAVTPLSGARDNLSPCRVDADTDDVPVAEACPPSGPGTVIQFEYDPGTGPVTASFDVERSYTNFALYLYDKLQPDYFAINIEMNMFKEFCPGQWSGMVDLYHSVYDTVRPHVEPGVKVFTTLTFKDLLEYEIEACHGPLKFETCTGAPSPPDYPDPDPEVCYPLDLSAVNDLDRGDRLEILALSFYPDSLLMATGDDTVLRVYPEDWDEVSDCIMRTQATPFCDPFAALDRFGWQKPVAVAELGARSCPSLAFTSDGTNTMIMQPPGDNRSQAFWLDHALQTAKEKNFEFYVQVFLRDYPPLGLWTTRPGPFDQFTYSIFNSFPCMGIYDQDGNTKDQVTDVWLDALP